jgi:hypothetical protein
MSTYTGKIGHIFNGETEWYQPLAQMHLHFAPLWVGEIVHKLRQRNIKEEGLYCLNKYFVDIVQTS